MVIPDDGDVVSSAPGTFRLRWDIFLSFRGEDTRHSFTKRLYESLFSRSIRVFLDDVGLDRGDEIYPSLLKAIDDTAASIIILSPNYASSHWCLRELAKICRCGRLILPVFYEVDPSDVRKQKGPFQEHFKNHEERFGKEEVDTWREAMRKVGGIAGFVFQGSEDTPLVRRLVKRVLRELSCTPDGLPAFTVGIDARIEEVLKLLDLKSNGLRVLGMYGMGGVGKTTLAKALFNKIIGRFEQRSFIANVRDLSSKMGGLVSLQIKLISDLSSSTQVVNDANEGIARIEQIVNERRVLVVFDDIDDVTQLDMLIGKREWFQEGSCIIITTRSRDVLIGNLVSDLYEVKELNSSDALRLFSYHALRREEPTDDILDLSDQIVSLTGRLPLALEVFGSFLFDKRRKEEWVDALAKLKEIRPSNLQEVLKISFNALDVADKCVFLDIACLFVDMDMKREDVIDILKGCGFKGELAITTLTQKSLIKIRENVLWMHDQLRDMGKQIVLEENLLDPSKRSRLWNRDEIMSILKGDKGTSCIQGMVLDFEFERKIIVKDPSGDAISWDNLKRKPSLKNVLIYGKERYKKCLELKEEKKKVEIIHTRTFNSMGNLRLLQVNNLILEGKFKFLPANIKWLQWKGCPFQSLPSDFCPGKLAVLDLSRSKNIETMWGWCNKKVAKNLRVMNLSHCYHLAAIPDLSGCQSLEKIVLEHCIQLIKLHPSIGDLSSLLYLNLSHCQNLVELPSDVSGLKNLQHLYLSGCSKLRELPESIAYMKNLEELLADDTAIAELTNSIFHLTKLKKLSLNGCKNLKMLPCCIGKLESLEELSLNGSALRELPASIESLSNLDKLSLMWCESLTAIPETIGNIISLTEIFLVGSGISELPASIGKLSYLRDLSIGNCRSLSKLPESIEDLACITMLHLDGTAIKNLPDQIGTMKMLRQLDMRNCKSLESLPKSFGGMYALTTLNMYGANITELPESFGMLENLVRLNMNKCRRLRKLPDSIGKLKSLCHFLMEETSLTELPESFGTLSSLRTLYMAKRPHLALMEETLPRGVEVSSTQVDCFAFPASFYNLNFLQELDARAWKLSGEIPDDFGKLASLEILKLGQNNFCSLPSSLKGLFILKKLLLPDCRELKFLPSLPSSLTELNVANCTALERISDLSNLEYLTELNLTNCEKLVDIPGLECFKSLRRLYMNGCTACSSAVKARISKVALRNLTNLSMPGNRIPDWFLGDAISFSKRKNHDLKGIIVGAIFCINHETLDKTGVQVPTVVDVLASILKLDKAVFTTALNAGLMVPSTNEEHILLCRYAHYHPLVSQLKDGYTLSVSRRNPAYDKRLELKKCGIYLVFEGDDEYEGEEESLHESKRSVSEKLARFFNSREDASRTIS